jgi:hypothetical protein
MFEAFAWRPPSITRRNRWHPRWLERLTGGFWGWHTWSDGEWNLQMNEAGRLAWPCLVVIGREGRLTLVDLRLGRTWLTWHRPHGWTWGRVRILPPEKGA